MKVVILSFFIWAGLGGALFAVLNYFDAPRWWLVVYGFGTMAIFLILAIISSGRNKPTEDSV